MPNSRFGYSVKKNSFKGLNIDCVQYSNIIRITYYSYSYSGTILNPNIICIRIRPNICAQILFVFVFAHSEEKKYYSYSYSVQKTVFAVPIKGRILIYIRMCKEHILRVIWTFLRSSSHFLNHPDTVHTIWILLRSHGHFKDHIWTLFRWSGQFQIVWTFFRSSRHFSHHTDTF